MANLPEAAEPSPIDVRWLKATRILVIICFMPLLLPFLGARREPFQIDWFSFFFFPIPWSLPFVHMLIRVGWRGYPQKSGLALAVLIGLGWGGAGLLFALLWATRGGETGEAIMVALCALVLLALAVCAIKTYYSIEWEEDDRRTLLSAFGPFILYSLILFVCAVALPGISRPRRSAADCIVPFAMWVSGKL